MGGAGVGGAPGWTDAPVGGGTAGTGYPQTGAAGAGQYSGDTPIGDALTTEQGTGDPLAGGTAADEWSATDEARR